MLSMRLLRLWLYLGFSLRHTARQHSATRLLVYLLDVDDVQYSDTSYKKLSSVQRVGELGCDSSERGSQPSDVDVGLLPTLGALCP